jgi:hypothetical protein
MEQSPTWPSSFFSSSGGSRISVEGADCVKKAGDLFLLISLFRAVPFSLQLSSFAPFIISLCADHLLPPRGPMSSADSRFTRTFYCRGGGCPCILPPPSAPVLIISLLLHLPSTHLSLICLALFLAFLALRIKRFFSSYSSVFFQASSGLVSPVLT